MSFKKNVAITGFPFSLIASADGSTITTGTVTGYVTIDGAAQASIAGSAAHLGNGQWSIPITSAEMNGDMIGLVFKTTDSLPASFSIKTVIKLTSELKDETMRGTDGANTTAPDNASIASILNDTNELQLNQSDWVTATGFSTFNPATDTVVNVTNVTNNADMRGTDSAALASSLSVVDSNVDSILIDTSTTIQANQTTINNNVLANTAIISDIPTAAEFNARTLPSSSYSQFDYTLNEVKANISKINGTAVVGSGIDSDLWRA